MTKELPFILHARSNKGDCLLGRQSSHCLTATQSLHRRSTHQTKSAHSTVLTRNIKKHPRQQNRRRSLPEQFLPSHPGSRRIPPGAP